MPIRSLHRALASTALRVSAPHGFALGGGNALIAHAIIDRVTEDVDLFTDNETGVEAAADLVDAALRQAGFGTDRRDKTAGLADIFPGMGAGLAEWILTAPSGEQTLLQMAYFERTRPPVSMDVGPVLALEDVLAGKICALASRVEPRDYVDAGAALGRYTVAELIGLAKRLDAGLTSRDFAEAGLQLDAMPDSAFAPFGLSTRDVSMLRERFSVWPRSS